MRNNWILGGIMLGALTLTACGPTIVGANERSIVFGSLRWQDADQAFSMADAHCRKYGRVARLSVVDSWSQQASYDCIPGDATK